MSAIEQFARYLADREDVAAEAEGNQGPKVEVQIEAEPRTYHSDRLGAVTIPED